VAVKQNNIPKIREFMENAFSLQSEIVLQRRAGREYLYVLRFSRLSYHELAARTSSIFIEMDR